MKTSNVFVGLVGQKLEFSRKIFVRILKLKERPQEKDLKIVSLHNVVLQSLKVWEFGKIGNVCDLFLKIFGNFLTILLYETWNFDMLCKTNFAI